jgi:hypothetical protein
MCIDVPGSSTGWGVQLVQWGCTNNSNQSWRLEAQNGGYRVVSNYNNLCWDVPYSSISWGAALTQYPCTGGWNQTFYKADNEVGTMSLVAAHSQQCVDVTGYGQNWGAGLQQWPCSLGDNQMFTTTAKPAFGYIQDIVGTDTGVLIVGWTIAANAPQYQLGYQVIVNGQVINAPYTLATEYRPDVAFVYPGTGANRGIYREFPLDFLVPGAVNSICIQSQSWGVYSNLRCGEVGLSESYQVGPGSTAVPLDKNIPNCKLRVPKINGIYKTINIEDSGLSGGASVNYSNAVLAAGNQWSSKMSRIQFSSNLGSDPTVKVYSMLTNPAGSDVIASTRAFCGGFVGQGRSANQARVRVAQSKMVNKSASDQTLLLVHELGHAFGLGHPGAPPSNPSQFCFNTVMNDYGPCPQGLSYFPTSSDVAAVSAKYP